MFRKILTTAMLTMIGLAGYAHANEPGISIVGGKDGPSRYLIVVHTTSGPDEIEIRLSDDEHDDLLEEMKVRIRVNDDHDELPSADEEFVIDAAEVDDVFLVVRSWGGMDTCIVESRHVDFPEAFLIYFEGGDDADVFDASDCDSYCWAIGGDGDDILIGGSAGDRLSGGDGLDYLDGGYGNDELVGGWDEAEDEIVGGPGADLLGKNVYLAMPIADGSFNYELLHSENYIDFDPTNDEIAIVELDERFNETATWSTNSVEKLGGGKQDLEYRGDGKRYDEKDSRDGGKLDSDQKLDLQSDLRNPREQRF